MFFPSATAALRSCRQTVSSTSTVVRVTLSLSPELFSFDIAWVMSMWCDSESTSSCHHPQSLQQPTSQIKLLAHSSAERLKSRDVARVAYSGPLIKRSRYSHSHSRLVIPSQMLKRISGWTIRSLGARSAGRGAQAVLHYK